MSVLRRAFTRVAAEFCYQYSRAPFARGYGRFGKWIAKNAGQDGRPYIVRRYGARWELYLEQTRYFADRALMLYGQYEPQSTTPSVIERLVKPGMVCLDVGANMGFYTVLMARLAQRVISFEPAISLHTRLLRQVELNDLHNVTTERLALSDHKGEGHIYVTPDTASIAPQHWSPDRAVSVDTFTFVTLDDYCASHDIHKIDFMKIDIDGHEPAFLRGAIATLSRLKPALIIEIVPECHAGGESTATEMCKTLMALGYRLSNGLTAPYGSAEEVLDRNPNGCNVLCRFGVN